MHILIIYRHYWPDTAPYSKLLQSMAEKWAKDGKEITVLTGQPTYNDIKQNKRPYYERYNNINIRRISLFPEKKKRLWIRFINFLIYLFHAFLHVFISKVKYNMIFINSYPPILMGFTARMIYKLFKIPYIYHCQDLHPESAMIAGQLTNLYLYNFLKKIDTGNCKNSFQTITLSQDMANTLIKRGVPTKKIHIVNNFIVDIKKASSDRLPWPFPKKQNEDFYILFAGNMGNFQGLDCIVEAAKILRNNKHIKFFFMGEGSAKKNLIKLSGSLLGDTIFFIPYQPVEIAFSAMQASDLGIISLKPYIYEVAFPSKTMMYLSAGCPLLAIVEKESLLATDIMNKELGYVCSERKPKQIAETINQAFRRKDMLSHRKEKLRKIGCEMFGRDMILEKWSDIFNNLEA